MTDQERIVELNQQIENQKVGAREVEKVVLKQAQRVAELERENKMLKDGLKIVGPLANRPDPA